VRREDLPPVEPEADGGGEDGAGGEPLAEEEAEGATEPPDDEEADGLTPLSDRLVADLTAHRTMGLRDALAGNPDAALLVLIHAAVLRTFYGDASVTCADIRFLSASLAREAEGVEEGRAARNIAERHEAWARQLPGEAVDAWAFVLGLDGDSRLALMAHCVGLTVNAVHGWERRPQAWAHADALAAMVGLDMTACWTPTARSYFGRVTRARIGEAVREAVSEDAAERIGGLKKTEMAEAAEQLVAETGWLPPLLRTASLEPELGEGEASIAHAAE